MEPHYSYLWEFQVNPDMEAAFERHYGSTGTWAQLFRLAPGYVETLLLKDNAVPGRYLTLDRWISRDAHDAFRTAFAQQYAQLDNQCEDLTVSERSLGAFGELPPGNSFKSNPLRGPA